MSPLSRRRFVSFLGAGAAGTLLAPTVGGRGTEALARELGLGDLLRDAPAGMIRLDSNENPNGPGRTALDGLGAALGEANRYPFASYEALRAAIATVHHSAPEYVLLGAGSTDILRAAVHASTSPARALVAAAPTFETPATEAAIVGAPVRAVPVADDLRLDLGAMAAAAHGAGLVYLCNPNNPTATAHAGDAVQDFIGRVLRDTPDATILVDEAYHEYVELPGYRTMVPLALENPQVVVARTFSKVYGMAGLRVGYAVGRPDTLRRIGRHVLEIGVNQLGAAAARATLADQDRVPREVLLNHRAREFTRRGLEKLGYPAGPSDANFVMVDVRRDVKAFREACRTRGVAVGRPFPPLATYARISIGTMDEMQRAMDVFRKVLTVA